MVDWVKVGKNYKIKSDGLNMESVASEKVRGLKSMEVEVLGRLVMRAVG